MKPANLSIIIIPPVNIGLTIITKLEIDLTHINYGLDIKTKTYKSKIRSDFSEIEVAQIFSSLDKMILSPSGLKNDFMYFAKEINYLAKDYLMTFCINKYEIHAAGIITLYQIRKKI